MIKFDRAHAIYRVTKRRGRVSCAQVTALRRHLLRHRTLAGWVFAAALLMKVLVPAGFMPTVSNGTMIVQICNGYGPQTMVMEIPGKADHDQQDQHGKTEMPCAFSGLSAPSLAAADPVLLALAILFVMAMGLRTVPPLALSSTSHLRPPLRGPPAHA
ncbi:hypothetical protein ACG3SL_05400 [Sphingomonas sp. CJ20]